MLAKVAISEALGTHVSAPYINTGTTSVLKRRARVVRERICFHATSSVFDVLRARAQRRVISSAMLPVSVIIVPRYLKEWTIFKGVRPSAVPMETLYVFAPAGRVDALVGS